ncbi:hypothetical protein, partial [uncultured Bradyrhizobium sp.]|uniref:hypothetical protein n=1 Tax=uncultured Bradyrhizobium sp. TaxID=199684 RepID=UPI0027D97105
PILNLVIGAEENDVIVPVVSNSGLHRSQRLLLFDAYKGIPLTHVAMARDTVRVRYARRCERTSDAIAVLDREHSDAAGLPPTAWT